MAQVTLKGLYEELDFLRRHIQLLQDRVSQIEIAAREIERQEAAGAAAAPPEREEFSEEILMAISAAVAAYLGARPRIRAIRLVRSGAWAQEGRVSIQASHRLNIQHHQHN